MHADDDVADDDDDDVWGMAENSFLLGVIFSLAQIPHNTRHVFLPRNININIMIIIL